MEKQRSDKKILKDMGATEEFANWTVSTQYDDIPAKGIEIVKRSVLDWIGCALVGSRRPEARIVVDYTREQGGNHQARLVAPGVRTTSINAAFANGVMGHLEDFDDSGAHPASYLTPTVLALGEELHLPGRQVLLAWAIGYDVSTRIGVGLHPDRAWHTTAIYGTMGATAGASKLLGLDVYKTRMAFGIGASEAAGVMRNFGTMTKSLHPGNAARSGIVAAKLASHGFTADPDIIEARYGFADCFGGEKCCLPAMTQFLGEVSYITSKGPSIKVWPCCSGNHRTLTGIMNLLQRYDIHAGDIVRVEHYSSSMPGSGPLQRSEVREGLDGKFCLEYNIAAAFIDKKIDLTTFGDERIKRGDLQMFMKKIHRYQDPEAALHSSRTKDGLDVDRLRVFMKDDTVHDLKLGPRMTLMGEAVLEKFRSNASLVLSSDAVEHVISLVQNLDKIADTNELMDTITGK
jgi:2-methylcitrate dehydratase PrpD